MAYDIFISYRRDGGEYTAKILHDKLTELGYKVFFDVESLRSGQFNTKLFSVIDECKDFITVLSPNSLERCFHDNDWVRMEIGYALSKGKNVIPVLLRGFYFPEVLPQDINALRYQNGIEASSEFFDAFVVKLKNYLKSKPLIVNRIKQNSLVRKVTPLVIALFIVFGVIFSGYRIYQSTHATFPNTKTEKNIVSEVIYYLSTNLSYMNLVMSEYDSSIEACKAFIEQSDSADPTMVISDLEKRKYNILEAKGNFIALGDNLSDKIDGTVLQKDDIIAVYTYINQYSDEMLDNIDYMSYLLNEIYITPDTKKQLLGYYENIINIEKDVLYYGVNDILLEVNEDALHEFKSDILPTVPYLYDGQEWRDDKDELKTLVDTAFHKNEMVVTDIASVVGNLNLQKDKMETAANAALEQADELTALKEEAREKFKPLESDDVNILWGKMLRFHTLGMYDMCIQCLEMYQQKDASEEATIYVPIAMEYFNQIEITGIEYGCMVTAYEPDKPHNSFYQLGDILIELNGQIISTSADIKTAKGNKDSNYTVKVLRFNGPEFEVVEHEFNPGEAKVMFYDLCEVVE